MKVHGMEWKKYVGVCCNGVLAVAGKHCAIVAQIKDAASGAKFIYSSVLRQPLAARKMPAILKTVQTEGVKVVNFIKSIASNSKLFSILCNEMEREREHDKLLLSEVSRLSRTNVLSRPFGLRSEVQIFLSNTASG
jgi:hypothetical protein